MNTGGAHLLYGTTPDIAVFAKGMSNGYAMAAVIGTQDVMQAAQGSFISSTYWTEKIGPVAALATIRKHRELNVPQHLAQVGEMMRDGWRRASEKAGVSITVTGVPALTYFSFDCPNAQAVRTLFTQMMLERGYLATNAFYATYAHKPSHMEKYAAVVEDVFAALARAVETNQVEALLKGPVAHAGFQRLS
jgi:glutamate-1-semialdehyde aminotransferase